MLNAELRAEEEAKRTDEAKKLEAAKAKEEPPKEGDGLPRAEVPGEAKPDAGGEAAGRELEALRIRAAELDDRLRRKGLRKAERNKIAEELAGVQARMQELSGGNLVLFSRGDGAQGRPALSPTKAALRDRLLLKIAQTAGIRVIREGTEAIAASAARAQGEARMNAMRRRKLKPHEWFVASAADYARLASQVGTLWHERGDVDAYYLDGGLFLFAKSGGCTETLKCWTCSARMSPMKNLNPDVEERTKKWFTPTRAIIVRSLAACGMRLDAIMAVLTGLKTEEQLRILGLGWRTWRKRRIVFRRRTK